MQSTVHASAFAYQGAGCLVLGPSGSGKSRLIAEALTLGATLIADDQVVLQVEKEPAILSVAKNLDPSAVPQDDSAHLFASPPPSLVGLIELHGMGIIRVDPIQTPHPIHLVIELSAQENERLQKEKYYEYSNTKTPLLMLKAPHVPSLLLYMAAVREGRVFPQDAVLKALAS